jgi:hypothetical protein
VIPARPLTPEKKSALLARSRLSGALRRSAVRRQSRGLLIAMILSWCGSQLSSRCGSASGNPGRRRIEVFAHFGIAFNRAKHPNLPADLTELVGQNAFGYYPGVMSVKGKLADPLADKAGTRRDPITEAVASLQRKTALVDAAGDPTSSTTNSDEACREGASGSWQWVGLPGPTLRGWKSPVFPPAGSLGRGTLGTFEPGWCRARCRRRTF